MYSLLLLGFLSLVQVGPQVAGYVLPEKRQLVSNLFPDNTGLDNIGHLGGLFGHLTTAEPHSPEKAETYEGDQDPSGLHHILPNPDLVLPQVNPNMGHLQVSGLLPNIDLGHIQISGVQPNQDLGHLQVNGLLPNQDPGHIQISGVQPNPDLGHIKVNGLLPNPDPGHVEITGTPLNPDQGYIKVGGLLLNPCLVHLEAGCLILNPNQDQNLFGHLTTAAPNSPEKEETYEGDKDPSGLHHVLPNPDLVVPQIDPALGHLQIGDLLPNPDLGHLQAGGLLPDINQGKLYWELIGKR